MDLDQIANGLSPDLVQFKSQEYREEFEKFKADLLKQKGVEDEWVDDDDDLDDIAFRSFVMHKVAALDIVLSHIVAVLNEDDK